MSILKAEIKNNKQTINDMVSFEGKIANYEEFKKDIAKILENYKPKKKEYEEIVKRLKDHITIENEVNDNISVTSDKKKTGFFGMFKKK